MFREALSSAANHFPPQLVDFILITSNQFHSQTPLIKCVIIGTVGLGITAVHLGFKRVRRVIYKQPPEVLGLPFIGSLATILIFQQKFDVNILPKYGDVVTYNIAWSDEKIPYQ